MTQERRVTVSNALPRNRFAEIVDNEIVEAWELFESTDDKSIKTELQAALVERYKHLAIKAARKYVKFLPYRPIVESDDLLGEAFIGLIQAINSFRISYNVRFETHAFNRISGQIIDGLRKMQNFPRANAKAKREIAPLFEAAQQILGKTPTIRQVAEIFPKAMIGGMLGRSIWDYVDDPLIIVNVFNQVCNASSDDNNCDSRVIENQASRNQASEFNQVLSREETIRCCLSVISDKDQKDVFYYYWFVGYTVPRIAVIMKRSATWVSSKRRKCIETLKVRVKINKELAIAFRSFLTDS